MQQVFRNAVYHVEPTVLGRRLLPFSLGHVYLLMAAESPFACDGARSLGAFVFAVGICSRTWEDGLEWVKSPTLAKECRAWGKRCRNHDFVRECAAFELWIDAACAMPVRYSPETSKPTKHPWPLLIATALAESFGESRAWNMPLPLAISYWSARAELNGDASLKSDEDEKARAAQVEYAKQQAALQKKAGA